MPAYLVRSRCTVDIRSHFFLSVTNNVEENTAELEILKLFQQSFIRVTKVARWRAQIRSARVIGTQDLHVGFLHEFLPRAEKER